MYLCLYRTNVLYNKETVYIHYSINVQIMQPHPQLAIRKVNELQQGEVYSAYRGPKLNEHLKKVKLFFCFKSQRGKAGLATDQ